MDIKFKRLIAPDDKIARTLQRWSNDLSITHLIRPNQNQSDIEGFFPITVESLEKIIEDSFIYLIFLNGQLVGEMNFQVNPIHLYKKDSKTAWIGLVIGEKTARGKGVGFQAITYLERRIWEQKIPRVELGVFEFNQRAINLYKKLGYQEIGRIENFTFWNEKMWRDIRMEKYLK